MTTIDRRLSKLEQGRQPAVHRPPDMSSDEFFRNMVAALAPIDAGVSPEEFGRAASPWLDAMTPTELQDLAVGLDATLADRGDQEQVQTDGHRRSA